MAERYVGGVTTGAERYLADQMQDPEYREAYEAERQRLADVCPDCGSEVALLDGDRLARAGIEGGDLLYCPKCEWIGRPDTEV